MASMNPGPVFGAQPSAAEIAARMAGYGAWLEIDLDAIGRNLGRLRRRLAPGTDLMPCVKNNAYGHGLLPVVAYLAEQGVARILVVRLREAEQIVDAGIRVRVLNMGPLFTDAQYESVARRGIVQAVYTREVAEQLSDAAGRLGVEAAVFVKVDTGLRRVGVWHEEAAELVERVAKLPGVRLEGIFSTLSQSAEQDPVQLERLLGGGRGAPCARDRSRAPEPRLERRHAPPSRRAPRSRAPGRAPLRRLPGEEGPRPRGSSSSRRSRSRPASST